MSILLSKNEKHRQEMTKQAELNAFKQRMSSLSDELIDWTESKDLTIADFENLISITRQRFELTFGKTKINKMTKDGN